VSDAGAGAGRPGSRAGAGAVAGRPFPGRRDALARRLAAADVDALLVTDLVNVRYLTGFTGSAGVVLVTADRAGDRFVTDGRYTTQAADEVPDLPTTVGRGRDWLPEALAARARLGVEGHTLPWDEARALQVLVGAEVVPASGHVEALRAVKDDDELAALARACALGDEAFTALLEKLRPGMSERDVGLVLAHAMLDRGAEALAFPPIVASGPNGARPHHRPGSRRLERGDVVTCDFGARVDGYNSDMTRVVALGPPSGELAAVLDLVRAAQAAGLAAVAAGVEAGDVDAACREPIRAAGYGEAFVHGTGHGIGLEPHEAPRVAAGATATLQARAVITVEPGIYLPGVGGARIEDTVVVGDDGPTVLTKTTKDLIVV
jgi:Xaa-Pro aminopeptidase